MANNFFRKENALYFTWGRKKISNVISSQVSGRAQLPGVIIFTVDHFGNYFISGGHTSSILSHPKVHQPKYKVCQPNTKYANQNPSTPTKISSSPIKITSTATKIPSTPTKISSTPTENLRCFVARKFLSQIYALFWCTFYAPKKYGGVPKIVSGMNPYPIHL